MRDGLSLPRRRLGGTWEVFKCVDDYFIRHEAPGNNDVRPLDTTIIASFAGATIYKNDAVIFDAAGDLQWENAPTLQKFENMARNESNPDWRYKLNLPLRSGEWQLWPLVLSLLLP